MSFAPTAHVHDVAASDPDAVGRASCALRQRFEFRLSYLPGESGSGYVCHVVALHECLHGLHERLSLCTRQMVKEIGGIGIGQGRKLWHEVSACSGQSDGLLSGASISQLPFCQPIFFQSRNDFGRSTLCPTQCTNQLVWSGAAGLCDPAIQCI